MNAVAISLRRVLVSIARFFISWRFAKIVLWTATLIVLFYAEEDWRGARAWAATKAKWEARGETFDCRKFIPPPVPDAQNLGAIPLFRLQRVRDANGTWWMDDVALREAVRGGWGFDEPPTTSGWIWGDLPNLDLIRQKILQRYRKNTPGISLVPDPLTQLETLYPFLPSFIRQAAMRHHCRFPYDDSESLPAMRSLALVTGQISLCKALALHAVLALSEQKTTVAFNDWKAALTLGNAAGDDPTLGGGLVSLSCFGISNAVIYEGLAHHQWSNSELLEIEMQLETVDFLRTYQLAIRSEAAYSVAGLELLKKTRRSDLADGLATPMLTPEFQGFGAFFENALTVINSHLPEVYAFLPSGWFDQAKALHADRLLRLASALDDQAQIAHPNVNSGLKAEHERDWTFSGGFNPWIVFTEPFEEGMWQVPLQFAYGQTRVDETKVACALERYRLKNRIYPEWLDALVATTTETLPHDIVNGQALKYRRLSTGGYLLYSIGWNQMDDGGKASAEKEMAHRPSHPSIDLGNADWVWPTPK